MDTRVLTIVLLSGVTQTLASLDESTTSDAKDEAEEREEGATVVEAPTSERVETIEVRARKRLEDERKVPLFINYYDGDILRTNAIPDLEALSNYVPGLMVRDTGSTSPVFFLRGIGSSNNQGFEQSVGTYVDGIYLGRGYEARSPLLDIHSVEILNGPQGTLYGNNTIGGTINITTARPTRDFTAFVNANYEPRHGEQSAVGVVSGPLTDAFSARLAVRKNLFDGYLLNTSSNRDGPSRDDDLLRLSVSYQPNNQLDVFGKVEIGNYDSDGAHSQISEAGNFLALYQVFDPLEDGEFNRNRSTTAGQLGLEIGGKPLFIDDFYYAQAKNSVLNVSYQYEGFEFVSLTGYNNYQYKQLIDGDFSPIPMINITFDQEHRAFSQEFRLASPADENFDYIIGLYYQDEDLESFNRDDLDLNPLGQAISLSRFGDFEQSSKSYAAFFHTTYRISDAFKGGFGIRYSKNEKAVSKFQELAEIGTLTPSSEFLAFAEVAISTVPYRYDLTDPRTRLLEENISPTLSFQYSAEDYLLYFNALRGFKGGGFDSTNYKGDLDNASFDEESATMFEVGYKTSFLSNRLFLDATLFHTKVDDLQVSVFDGSAAFLVDNAAEVVSSGVELSARFRLSEQWFLQGGLSLLDAYYDEFTDAQCTNAQQQQANADAGNPPGNVECVQDLSGKPTQYAPDYSGFFSARYEASFENYRFQALFNLQHYDQYFLASDIDPVVMQPSYTNLDINLRISDQAEDWYLALVGKNLLDELTSTFGSDIPQFSGAFFKHAGRPRSIGLQMNYQW